MQSSIEEAVYNTLAYYQALGEIPLTVLEIQRYCTQKEGDKKIPLFDIQQTLIILKNKGAAVEAFGLWGIVEYKEAIQKRLIGLQRTPIKWRVAKRRAWLLPLIPFVEGVTVTGSLALANAHDESDIDILLSVQSNAIWTVRFLATISSWLFGVRRYGKRIKNRLCLNHFSIENEASLGPKNIHAVVAKIGVDIWKKNQKKQCGSMVLLTPPKVFGLFKTFLEHVLKFTRLQKALETFMSFVQIRKIHSNPLGYPKELETPSKTIKNLIFYYPKVQETELRYKTIIKNI